jgi:hypothetical protein
MKASRDPHFGAWTVTGALLPAGPGRAPVFNAWGSYFPAWLVCAALGVLLTFAVRWLLRQLHIELVIPTVTYPSLAALFTFALWLAMFR